MKPISIIIPTLNEAENLPLLLRRIDSSLRPQSIPYEVIVVDDHSTDATSDIATSSDPNYNVTLLSKQGKPGKAFSLLEGFAAAKYDLLCMIDGDLQYPPEAIKQMYHKLQYCEADIVVTQRIDNQSGALRRLSSYIFNLLFTRLLFGIKYDTQSGLKLFRKSVLQTITVAPSPWTFDLEFIVRALEQGYVIVSQEIVFSKRHAGVAKIHLLSATYELATGSLKLWRNASTKRVKLNYKNLESWQRNTGLLIAGLLLTATATFALPGQAKALSAGDIFNPIIAAALPAVEEITKPTTAPVQQTDTPYTYTSAPVATPPKVTVAPLAPPTVVSAPVNDTPTQPVTNPNTQSKAAPQQISYSATPVRATSAQKPSSQTKIAVAQPQPAQTLALTSGDPATVSASNKDAKYYPINKLSQSRTQMLLQLALRIVLAGVACLGLGTILYAITKILGKPHHQPLGV